MIGSRHIEIRNQSQKLRPDALADSPMNIDKKNHKTKIMKVAFIFYSMIELNVDGCVAPI